MNNLEKSKNTKYIESTFIFINRQWIKKTEYMHIRIIDLI